MAQCTRAPITHTHSCNRPFQKAVAKQPPHQMEVVCPAWRPAGRPRLWWHGINRQQDGTKPHASGWMLAPWEPDRTGGILGAGSPDNQQVKPCSASAEGRQGGMPWRMGLHPCAQSCGCAVGCMPLRWPYWYGPVTFRAAPDTARGHHVKMPCASALQLEPWMAIAGSPRLFPRPHPERPRAAVHGVPPVGAELGRHEQPYLERPCAVAHGVLPLHTSGPRAMLCIHGRQHRWSCLLYTSDAADE